MDDLIEALQIASKYMSPYGLMHPTGCEHDMMFLNIPYENQPSRVDAERLNALSFYRDDEYDMWVSYRFGSC